MSFEPHEAAAKLRQLAADMKELADWKGDPQIDKDYGRRGFDLLTAAWVMKFWASRIEVNINAPHEGAPELSALPLDAVVGPLDTKGQ